MKRTPPTKPGVQCSLSAEEKSRRRECEAIIQAGLNSFVQVGSALKEIQQSKLYRNTHGSFEAYAKEMLDLSRPRAYELIEGAGVVNELSAIADIPRLPTNEGQARALRKWAEPNELPEKWKVVIHAAEGRPITAKLIKETLHPTGAPALAQAAPIAQHEAEAAAPPEVQLVAPPVQSESSAAPLPVTCALPSPPSPRPSAPMVALPPAAARAQRKGGAEEPSGIPSNGSAKYPLANPKPPKTPVMPADRVPATAYDDTPLFTFANGREFRAADWPAGWIAPEELVLKLKNVTTRNENAVCHNLTQEEILELQEDVEAFGRVANERGGGEPSPVRLRCLRDAMYEIGNLVGVKSKG